MHEGNDTLDIRNALMRLIEKAPAGGIFTHAETEIQYRNEFSLRLDPEGPIYTVRVSYGGSLSHEVTSLGEQLDKLYADWRADRITDAEYRTRLAAVGYRKEIGGGHPVPKS